MHGTTGTDQDSWLHRTTRIGTDMTMVEMIGYGAALLTTGSFLPQAWHTFRTRDVSGISLGMYGVFVAGTALWLSYGLLIAAWPVVIANGVTLALALAILVMKLRFQHRQPRATQVMPEAASAHGRHTKKS